MGMSHEEIVLMALYILDRIAMIALREEILCLSVHYWENIVSHITQDRLLMQGKLVMEGLVPLGKVQTPKGICVSQLSCTQGEENGQRDVREGLWYPLRRIVSTREVSLQRDGSITHADALEHRLNLMNERKYYTEDRVV